MPPLLPDLVKKKTGGKRFLAAFASLLLGTSALAGVVSYEGNEFPEVAIPPWARSGTLDCERWIDRGWFVQNVDLGVWAPPPGGEQDRYQRLLAGFGGSAEFFIEWRLYADGDSSEITGTAPASLVATSDTGGIQYHFTIARDQARLIRDNFLPIVYVSMNSGLPHTHRLELRGQTSYVWYIDGRIVDSGIPEGAFPGSDADRLSFRAKSEYLDNTVWWDYIRYGVIPRDRSGDYDSNGVVDATDVYFFLDCLLGPDANGPGCRWADMNSDGKVNGDDIQPFAAALAG